MKTAQGAREGMEARTACFHQLGRPEIFPVFGPEIVAGLEKPGRRFNAGVDD